MLEIRVQDLEGANGTGTFEQDLQLLKTKRIESTKFACVAYRYANTVNSTRSPFNCLSSHYSYPLSAYLCMCVLCSYMF
jgi:hypothetical protein